MERPGKSSRRVRRRVQVKRLHPEPFGHLHKVRRRFITAGENPLPVKQVLLLPDQSEAMIVHDDNLEVHPLLDRRSQFLDVHHEAPVAAETDDSTTGGRQGSPDGCGHSEPHGSEPRRGEPLPWAAKRVDLGRPHLVLTHVGDHDGLIPQEPGYTQDEPIRIARIVPIGNLKGVSRPQGVDR